MNRSDFTSLLTSPEQLSAATLQGLSDLIHDYPYCQSLQVLYTQNLHALEDVGYQKQLKLASAYATDRKRLYQLIMQPAVHAAMDEADSEIPESIATEAVVEEIPAPIETAVPEVSAHAGEETRNAVEISAQQDNKKPVEQPAALTKEPQATFEALTPEATTSEPEETPQANEAKLPDMNPVEQEIIREAISVSYILEPEVHILAEEVETVHASEEEEPKEVHPTDESTEPPSEMTLGGWLDWLDNKPAPSPRKATNPKALENDLIDQFIQNKPSVPAPKAEFFSPTNMARMSLLDNEDFVTETLAKIYAQQGKIDKAKRVYEKLMLKFPEKSDYFAAQLKILEQGS